MQKLEDCVKYLSNYSQWNESSNISTSSRSRQKDIIQNNHICHQNCLIRFLFSQNYDQNMLFELKNISRNGPNMFFSRFPPAVLTIISNWIISMIKNPEALSLSIIKYYAINCTDALMWANVSFPSIFFNFQTAEFAMSAASFLVNMVHSSPQKVFKDFVISFFISNPNLHMIARNNIGVLPNNKFGVFKIVKIYASVLTEYHILVLKAILDKDPKIFSQMIIAIALKLTREAYSDNSITVNTNPFLTELSNIVEDPESTLFCTFTRIITQCKYLIKLPNLKEFCAESRVPIVLSCHEVLIMKEFIEQSEEIVDKVHIRTKDIKENNRNRMDSIFLEFSIPNFAEKNEVSSGKIFNINYEIQIKDGDDENNTNYERAYRQLEQICVENGLYVWDFFSLSNSNPKVSLIVSKYPILRDQNFAKFCFAKKQSDMVKRVEMADDFVEYAYHWKYNKELMMKNEYIKFALLLTAVNSLSKKKPQLINKSKFTPKEGSTKAPSIVRMQCSLPPVRDREGEIEAMSKVLTTACFSPQGNSIPSTRKHRGSIIQSSTFELEEPTSVTETPVIQIRQRRGSADFDSSASIKQAIAFIVNAETKCNSPDIKLVANLSKLSEMIPERRVILIREHIVPFLVSYFSLFPSNLSIKFDAMKGIEKMPPFSLALRLMEIGSFLSKSSMAVDKAKEIIKYSLFANEDRMKSAIDAFIYLSKIESLGNKKSPYGTLLYSGKQTFEKIFASIMNEADDNSLEFISSHLSSII